MAEVSEKIMSALNALPSSVLEHSGSIFYSGKEAFAQQSEIYFVGINPGGRLEEHANYTIGKHIEEFMSRSEPWSAYFNDPWKGNAGEAPLQRRVLHMMRILQKDSQLTPASNMVFRRSATENKLTDKESWQEICWPVHQAIIENLRIRVIVCFGQTTGAWFRKKLTANEEIDQCQEKNRRRWTSRTHRSSDGHFVVTVTHPSRADWTKSETDPSGLVRRALEMARS